MSTPEWRDGIDEPTRQPSALGGDFADTHTIRSHRIIDQRQPRPRRTLVIAMVLAVLVTGVLVAQAAIGGGSPGPADSSRPRLTRTDALTGDGPSLWPPMTWHPSVASSPATPSPSASAPSLAPSPAAAPSSPAPTQAPPFIPVTVEAEAALLLGSASAVGCAPCSGGLRVGYISANSAVVVRADISRTGTRTVRVTYETDGQRQLKVQLNGIDVDTRWLTGDSWEVPMTFEFAVVVPAGPMELRFYNDLNPAPDIDKVMIS